MSMCVIENFVNIVFVKTMKIHLIKMGFVHFVRGAVFAPDVPEMR